MAQKKFFTLALFIGNEWITAPILMKFLADYCYCYKNNLTIFGYSARELFQNVTIYLVPMVNPDGVDLVTGEMPVGSRPYLSAQQISNNYPNINIYGSVLVPVPLSIRILDFRYTTGKTS